MPSSRLENIIKMNFKDIRALGKKDMVIISGGSMDINKNEAKMGLRHLKNLVMDIQNTNILIVTVPHRYGLQESSCINNEIAFFNKKLQKIMMTKDNVKIVQANLNRNYFTQHGRHLNANGKDKTVELIKQTINRLKTKPEKSPIVLKWMETHTTLIHNELKDKTPNQNASIKTTVAASKTIENGDSSKITSPVSAAAATTVEADISLTAAKVATSQTGAVLNTIRKSKRIKNAVSELKSDLLW
jgi:hypothetical protein